MTVDKKSSESENLRAGRNNLVAPKLFERRRQEAAASSAKKKNIILALSLALPIVGLIAFGILYRTQSTARLQESESRTQAMIEERHPGIGKKPVQDSSNNSSPIVEDYLKNNLNDYGSAELISWLPAEPVNVGGQSLWSIKLRLRAKNAFGGMILRDAEFFIRNDQVVDVKGLRG